MEFQPIPQPVYCLGQIFLHPKGYQMIIAEAFLPEHSLEWIYYCETKRFSSHEEDNKQIHELSHTEIQRFSESELTKLDDNINFLVKVNEEDVEHILKDL